MLLVKTIPGVILSRATRSGIASTPGSTGPTLARPGTISRTTWLGRLASILRSNFAYDWSGQFGLTSLAAGDVLVEGGTPFAYLSFPIPYDLNGNSSRNGVPYTAYTAPVSSVMDQSMPNGPYSYNGIVVAFDGETGDNQSYCYNPPGCSVIGYSKTGGGYFFEDANGNKLINYPAPSGEHNDTRLFYDGHPGYDYPFSQGTYIVAPEGGTLCVATANTQSYGAGTVWRDPTRCPLAALAGSTTWDTNGHEYHAFYIVHSGLNINGSPADYITGFLHSNNLEGSIQSSIEQHGYATVTKGQFVAQVGGWGTSGANTYGYHMHLEIYKKSVSTSNWDLVDPYGDGTNNILWSH